MNQAICPYITISEQEALKMSNKEYASYVATNAAVSREDKKAGVNPVKISFSEFSLVPKAEAQATQNTTQVANSMSEQLSVPFYLIIGSFFIFVLLMSVIYMYHWQKFSLGDHFIKNFSPLYFVGLVLLSIPLIFNLFF